MRAAVITEPGGPDVLKLLVRPTPAPEAGEVLIKVVAAGVNRPDVAQRKGNYPPPPGAPADIPGLEISGYVVAAGTHCRRWKIGDRVCALTIGGGYAEYCAVPEGQCMSIPPHVSLIVAASLPETYMTVWSNVFDRASLASGETLLVHGGAGGIGTAAVQIATAAGARVIVTAGSDEKCHYCLQLGAVLAINYKKQNFREVIEGLSGDKSVNVVLDMIGGTYTNENLKILSPDGRLVLINYMGGGESTIGLGPVLTKRLTITGSTLRSRSIGFKTALAQKLEEKVWPWLEEGKIKPVVDKVYPLDEVVAAHRRMEDGLQMGKIVLNVSEDRM